MVNDFEKEFDSKTEAENALDPSKDNKLQIPETVVVPEKQAEGSYHIIAGSFRDTENAEALQRKLAMEGYPAVVIEPGNGIYRVSAIAFTNKNKALEELVRFRKQTGLEDSWLMTLE
jgi:cell division protein FtsN